MSDGKILATVVAIAVAVGACGRATQDFQSDIVGDYVPPENALVQACFHDPTRCVDPDVLDAAADSPGPGSALQVCVNGALVQTRAGNGAAVNYVPCREWCKTTEKTQTPASARWWSLEGATCERQHPERGCDCRWETVTKCQFESKRAELGDCRAPRTCYEVVKENKPRDEYDICQCDPQMLGSDKAKYVCYTGDADGAIVEACTCTAPIMVRDAQGNEAMERCGAAAHEITRCHDSCRLACKERYDSKLVTCDPGGGCACDGAPASRPAGSEPPYCPRPDCGNSLDVDLGCGHRECGRPYEVLPTICDDASYGWTCSKASTGGEPSAGEAGACAAGLQCVEEVGRCLPSCAALADIGVHGCCADQCRSAYVCGTDAWGQPVHSLVRCSDATRCALHRISDVSAASALYVAGCFDEYDLQLDKAAFDAAREAAPDEVDLAWKRRSFLPCDALGGLDLPESMKAYEPRCERPPVASPAR